MVMNLPERPAAPAATIDLHEVGNPKHNAFWFACSVDGGRVNYAACMTKTAIIGTSLNPEGFTSWPECRKAIRCGNCLFKQMRETELTEGKPIWFVPREGYDPTADAMKPAEVPKWAMPSTQPAQKKGNWRSDGSMKIAATPTEPITKTKAPVGDLSYAAAINNHMAKSVAEKQRDVTPVEVSQNQVTSDQVNSGDRAPARPEGLAQNSSLLARARAMIAANKTQ